jgi:protein subunit release factor B
MSAMVQISAGTGPIEVRRFVALLAEHLALRCEEEGAVIREVVVHGDEAEPASVEIHVAAAMPWMTGLCGTHALVARSEDRGKKARKRWYAGVRLCEASTLREGVAVRREDVTITAMRASGPGGQKVNKTASAVRIHHAPSGVTVRALEERSQRDNVRAALSRLGRILAERASARAEGERASRRLSHYRVERGSPVVTYELNRDGGLSSCEKTCSR